MPVHAAMLQIFARDAIVWAWGLEDVAREGMAVIFHEHYVPSPLQETSKSQPVSRDVGLVTMRPFPLMGVLSFLQLKNPRNT